MIKDGLITLTNASVSYTYRKCSLNGLDGIFIGQQKDGDPFGYIRFISTQGNFYEGTVNKDGVNGWGIYIKETGDRYDDIKRTISMIGWWRKSKP